MDRGALIHVGFKLQSPCCVPVGPRGSWLSSMVRNGLLFFLGHLHINESGHKT